MGEISSEIGVREVGYSEALASWCTRYLSPTGFECQLVLEAETGLEVLKKGEAALACLIEQNCMPISFHGTNGGSNASKTVLESGEKHFCSIHKIEMKRWSKGDRTWYSHRWEGGWCKGEEK